MKGIGTDEDAIIEVLCKRTVFQRMQIVNIYKTNYGKDLIKDIKGETDGTFRDLLVALMTPTDEYLAEQLKDTSTATYLDIMPTLTNEQIRDINAIFKQKYGKTLEQTIMDNFSGGFRRLMVAIANGNRDEMGISNTQMARADAMTVKSVVIDGETDDIAVNQILCQRNFDQIKLIAQEYKKLTNHEMEDDIKNKFSGDHQSGLKSILRFALNKAAYFATRLYKAMDGIGTRNKSLNRIIITRSEIDMENIKDEFEKMYNEPLRKMIGGDTRGDYKHALYTLINEREKPQ